jgi:protein-L-isoaspartate(D-aspartate) O-methyltransferase
MPCSDGTRLARAGMVERLRRRGIGDVRVRAAMASVPRERFVPAGRARDAYLPRAMALAAGQTISAPDIVAAMAAALTLDASDEVLEVGTGSGYAAAVLSRCSQRVTTIERHRVLADHARATLAALGYTNIEVRHGDGSRGAWDRAPFDAISVAAMADDIPRALIAQLAPNGRLVCPVGTNGVGQLIRLHGGRREVLLPVAFVPLVTDGSAPYVGIDDEL